MAVIGALQETEEKFEDEDIQSFFEFLKTLKGESEIEMITAISAEYFRKPLLVLCEKMEIEPIGNKDILGSKILNWFSVRGK